MRESVVAAERAVLTLRLADAERMFAFACDQGAARTDRLRSRADLALLLGQPRQALAAYRQIAARGGTAAELERRTAALSPPRDAWGRGPAPAARRARMQR